MTTSPSFEESSDLFHSESNQLESNINSALNKHERLPISEIVEIYYQVIKVGSISKLLKENFQSSSDPKQQILIHEIHDAQDHIRKKFDKTLHPRVMSQLTDSIQEYTDNLKSLAKETDQKSKETIESEAKLYKELRELMSTKEFTIQYENGLKND